MLSPFLSSQVELAHDGPTWHGASLAENLRGVTAEQAASRPIPEAHSIWEIVLHLTAWTGEVARRLRTGDPRLPESGDWPEVGLVSDAGWTRAVEALQAEHRELAKSAARFGEDRWSHQVGAALDAPLGTGVSYAAMVAGLVQHDAYHGGQIGLLRKALGL